MIRERKEWMTYTYFNRSPELRFNETHLFSFVRKTLPFMVRIPFPTMVIHIEDEGFVQNWSKSSRYKINRADKEGLHVDCGHHLLDPILKLFSVTAHHKGLRGYLPQDFESLPSIICSAVIHEGIMICGHVWLLDVAEKRALLFVNASHHHETDDASLTGRAHYFQLWQDGLFLRQHGITVMDLQGYEPNSRNEKLKGVYQWKEGTHGLPETLYHYYPAWFFVLRKFRNMVSR